MVLQIVTYPNRILRQKGEAVKFPLSKSVKKLTQDMMDTVRQADGVGLAAPQVGQPLRLAVINLEKNGVPMFALYNPRIIAKSFKKTEIEEGCLSIPQVFGLAKRPMKVTVEAQNARGEKVKFSDSGWIARVAQHEIDHINGILIIDHIKKYTKGEEIVKEWKLSTNHK